jgi:hypothetical protein
LRISFIHADAWKRLISRYIVTIPLIGDAGAIPSISADPPPVMPVSSAMIAKVGDAARPSTSANLNAAPFRRVASPSDPPEQP